MHCDLIIKNGTIVTPTECFLGDIAVKNGEIIKTGELDSSFTSDESYNAEGLHIMPGIIDAHVHFRDPGLTEKEDFETGSIAAAFGGVTMVADMPNTIPVTSTKESLDEKIKIAKEKSYIDYALFALLNNDNYEEMENLKNKGALGFKVFFGSSTGDIACPSFPVLAKQMEKAANMGIRIGFHAETNEIINNFTVIAKTEAEEPDGFWFDYARPVISEIKAIEIIIKYAFMTKAKILIHHITTEHGVLLAHAAKEEGISLSVETCPHYLLFNCNEFTHKVYPPIRDESQVEALWEYIKNGTIDMIASDHAPHKEEEKSLPGWDAPGGLSGVETLVPLLLNEVNKNNISINDFVRLLSEAPAKTWGIYPKKGNLLPGSDADITIVDMKKKKTINSSDLHSKSRTSPYHGITVQGLPVSTIVRGKFVVKDGVLTGKKGYGEFVTPVL